MNIYKLVQRARAGDKKAHEMLEKRFEKLINFFVEKYASFFEYEQEDFFQEVRIAFWEAIRLYDRSKGDFEIWAFNVILKDIIDLLRKGTLTISFVDDVENEHLWVQEDVSLVNEYWFIKEILKEFSDTEREIILYYISTGQWKIEHTYILQKFRAKVKWLLYREQRDQG